MTDHIDDFHPPGREVGPEDLGAHLDPADLDSDLVRGDDPTGTDALEADPADVAEQRIDVPVDDEDDRF